MKDLKLISSLLIILLLSACSKEKENITFTGRILTSCSGAPFANVDLTLWVDVNCLSLYPCYETYVAKTDANGNFSFTIPEGIIMEIRVGSSTILFGIPANKSLNLGTFYANPTTSFVYRIKVNNPYQAGDTLNINFRGKQDRIPAPLHDSIFPPVLNHSPLASQTYPINKTIPIPGNFAIFRGPSNIVNSNRLLLEEFSYNLPECNTKIDTITFVIN